MRNVKKALRKMQATLQLVRAVALPVGAEQPEDQSQSPRPSLPSRRARVLRPLPAVRPLQKPRGAAYHTCSHLVSGPLLLTHDEVLHEATQGTHRRRCLPESRSGSHNAGQRLWEGEVGDASLCARASTANSWAQASEAGHS